jgi:type III pantothenate kinase
LDHIERLAEGAWASLPPPERMLGCVVAGTLQAPCEEQLELWDVAPQWVVASAQEAGLVNGYDHPRAWG